MKYILGITALFLLGLAGWSFFYVRQEKSLTQLIDSAFVYKNASADLIFVERPVPGSVLGKNFSINGLVRGPWFFEASFPVNILDTKGSVLVAVPAQAKGEWMTENFVPFSADINIPPSYSGPATIVLKKDNPSGLPENDASISFNVFIK